MAMGLNTERFELVFPGRSRIALVYRFFCHE